MAQFKDNGKLKFLIIDCGHHFECEYGVLVIWTTKVRVKPGKVNEHAPEYVFRQPSINLFYIMYYINSNEIISPLVTPLMDTSKRAREYIVEISLNDAPVWRQIHPLRWHRWRDPLRWRRLSAGGLRWSFVLRGDSADYQGYWYRSQFDENFDPANFDILSARRRLYDYERTISEVLHGFYERW